MEISNLPIIVNKRSVNVMFGKYNQSDWELIRKDIELTKKSNKIKQRLGLRRVVSSELSEAIYCYITASLKYRSCSNSKGESMSFDAYNIKNKQTVQVKSTIIKNDCTSFGTSIKEDVIAFLDLEKIFDEKINTQKLSNKELVKLISLTYIEKKDIKRLLGTVINKGKNETVADQQSQGRRPRLSIKQFIKQRGLKSENILICK